MARKKKTTIQVENLGPITEANVEKIVDSIIENWNNSSNSNLIYRGTCKKFRKKDDVNSSIYRYYNKHVLFETDSILSPLELEKQTVASARRLFSPNTEVIEILTELQHFGGDTALIDFSRNIMVALFFACNGEFDKDGEVIISEIKNYSLLKTINYESELTGPYIIEPIMTDRSQVRALAQSSIFVYAPKGYIDREICEFVLINKDSKKPILEYLRGVHNISVETMYNDLPGFLSIEERFKKVDEYHFRGILYWKDKKYGKALKSIEASINREPERASSYSNRGAVKHSMKRYEEAIQDFEKAIHISPNSSGAYHNRGLVKYDMGRYKEAIHDYDTAIHIRPDHANTYYHRGCSKYKEKDYQGAIHDYDTAIHIRPDKAGAYYNRGLAKHAMKRYEEAIQDLDEAIRIDPDHAYGYNYRGLAKHAMKRYEEAIQDFDEAIRLDPNFATAYDNRGQAYKALGQDEAAEKDFRKAEKLHEQEKQKSKSES